MKIGMIYRDHEILDIYKKRTPYHNKKTGAQGMFNQSRVVVKCCQCGRVQDVSPSAKLGCTNTLDCSKRFTDYTGEVFGELTVLEVDMERTDRVRHRIYWKCKCSCGTIFSRLTHNLVHSKEATCNKCARIKQGLKKRLPNHQSYFNKIIAQMTKRIKKKNLAMDLSYEDCVNLFKSPCIYCNTPYFDAEDPKDVYFHRSGIDRVDNTKGYTHKNVVPCCDICNKMKLALPKDVFLKHIEKIYLNNKKCSETSA